MIKAIQYWHSLRRFQRLPRERRNIVFYSEGTFCWPHLAPIVLCLSRKLGHTVCYVSSHPDDAGLHQDDARILGFCIGDGTALTVFFRALDADVAVMTTPDLNSFHIKRSAYPVHYVYVPHSIVSTHMIYRPGAFDHFDTVFCVGPHQVEEIRETERLHSLAPKSLLEHGSGRLDSILAQARRRPPLPAASGRPAHVLVAPSWGPDGLLETIGELLVDTLLGADIQVSVRPHPETRRRVPAAVDRIAARFGRHPRFVLEENVASQDSFFLSDVMISDWSGAALEFAFGLERPVLFIDVPRKINNPEYTRLAAQPLEIGIRDRIGAVIAPDQLDRAPAAVERLIAETEAFQARIRKQREAWVFNPGNSAEVGARQILELAGGKGLDRPGAANERRQAASAGSDVDPGSLLVALAERLEDEPGTTESGHDVTGVLRRIAARVPEPPTPQQCEALDRLCSKVDIAGKVWAAYDADWRKPAVDTPLSAAAWPVLTSAFLYRAMRADAADVHGRGIALKMINSACNAIDLQGTGGANEHQRVLEAAAQRQLERFLAP